jgi:hypothetical protein
VITVERDSCGLLVIAAQAKGRGTEMLFLNRDAPHRIALVRRLRRQPYHDVQAVSLSGVRSGE